MRQERTRIAATTTIATTSAIPDTGLPVAPLFEGEWPDVQQVVFPMQYDADTLWDIAWLGAQWALGEAAA